MKTFTGKSLKAWFGYTRRERRASFILLILIVIIGGARYTVPQSDMEINITTADSIKPASPETDLILADTPYNNAARKVRRSTTQRILDINVCDSTALESLPGIGPVLAARIIKYRKLLGGYAFTDQLLEVYGLSPETFELIRQRINADSTVVSRIDVNTADFRLLIRFPYLDRFEVNSILKYRELEGSFKSIEELFDNKLVAEEKKRRVKAYLWVE